MARDEAYRKAEAKIEAARRTGANELDLSWEWNNEGTGKLTELPESLGRLTQLQTLELNGNQLKKLPESLGELSQLHRLWVHNNQLATLPESLSRLTKLRELALGDTSGGKSVRRNTRLHSRMWTANRTLCKVMRANVAAYLVN